MAAIDTYLNRTNVKRLLFLEITQGSTVFYIADSTYITEPADTPSSVPFEPIIGEGGLPSYRTTLSDPLSPRASSSVGSVKLISTTAMSLVSGASPARRDLMATVKRGAQVVCKIGAPRELFAYSDAITLFTARVRNIGGDSDGNLSLTLDTPARVLFDAVTPADRGVYGTVLNVGLRLADFATQRYTTHPGGTIGSVSAVYDDTVTLTAGSGYSVNTSTGDVTLTATPAGQVTADMVGYGDSTLIAIATQLASPYIAVGASALPTETAGYFHDESKSVADILDVIALSAGAFWMVNDAGQLEFRLWDAAGAPSDSYSMVLEFDYGFEQANDIFSSQPYLYAKNWTVQERARAGATAAHANAVALTGATASATAAGDGSAATVAPLIETLFSLQAPAAAVAARVCSFLGVARYVYSLEVPLSRAKALGDTIAIETSSGYVNGFVISREITADGGVPTQKLEAIV